MSKTQAAMEYLVLSTVLILIISLVLWYSFNIGNAASYQIKVSQLQNLVDRIVENSNLVCMLGKPAKQSFSAYVPQGVIEAGFANYTVYYKLLVDSTQVDIYGTSLCQLNGSLPTSEGYYTFVINAEEGYVNVTY